MNHYKLEDNINNVWSVVDLLDLFLWRYIDHPKIMTEDEVWNHVYGIRCILDLYCEKSMDDYCRLYELNEYAPPEVKALREKILGDRNVKEAIAALKKEQAKKKPRKTKKAK